MKGIKKLLAGKTKSVVIQFVLVIFILSGLAIGVVLVQQNQNYRERAGYGCSDVSGNSCTCCKIDSPCGSAEFSYVKCIDNVLNFSNKYTSSSCTTLCTAPPLSGSCCNQNKFGKCETQGGCPLGEACKRDTNGTCVSGYACKPDVNCCGDWTCSDFTFSCSGTSCVAKCKYNNKTHTVSDDLILCSACKQCTSGGGGGGNQTTNPSPTGSGSPSPSSTPASCSGAKPNPGTFSVNKTGKLVIYYNVQGIQGNPFQIAVKPNSTSCSLTDNAGVFNLTDNVTGKMETNLDVVDGQTVCFGVYYNQSSDAEYQDTTTNTCGGSLDITPNVTQAESENGVGSISSKQCWTNSPTECDFNDFAILFAIGGEGPSGGLSFKLRFQGITKLAGNQKVDSTLLQNNTQAWSGNEVDVTSNDTGAYTITIPDSIQSGTYNLLVKGHSHLQKRFTNVVYNGGNQSIDLSIDEDNQMRAGDVTDDNAITIEDISQVLSFYDSFSVEVDASDPKMVASDVDKNGKITIQDIALIAINWSDFRVGGDE